MRSRTYLEGELAKGGRKFWVKMQRKWVNGGTPKEWKGEFWARVVGESLGKENWTSSASVPLLSTISRLSDSFSLKRDERERKIKKSRAGETVSPKTPLVQGILARASHYSLKRVYQQKWLAQVLHISPRRDMFSLGEISMQFWHTLILPLFNFWFTFTQPFHDPFSPINS